MSLWCHRFDQNSNENIVRISALKFFKANDNTFKSPESPQNLPGSPQEATKDSGQKSLQHFVGFFGRFENTKKKFRN